jgi:integrase
VNLNRNSRKLLNITTTGSKLVARKKFIFTREKIDSLPNSTTGQPAYYYDLKVRGLAVSVSPLGKKTFILYRKVAGRPERIKIGPFEDLSIEQARGRAEQLNSDIAMGQNPAANRRKIRDEATLQELFNAYLEHHAKAFKRTWANDESMFNLHLASWHLRKISSIRKVDVITEHARIGRNHGKYAANRVIELLSSMFNRAKEWGWEGQNPAEKIKAFHEEKRERFMDAEELRAFFQSLSQELNETIRDYILVSLLTGARRSNVQAMRWAEVNWEQSVWAIPAAKAKAGEVIRVPLSPVALQILENRKLTSASEWVFPGRGASGHLVEPKTAWGRILERARNIERENWLKANPTKTEKDFAEYKPVPSLTDLRLHDLRRTLGSWQAATGASLPIIGKSLGHRSLAATQVYARLDLDPVRASVNKAVDAMLLAGNAQLLGEGK